MIIIRKFPKTGLFTNRRKSTQAKAKRKLFDLGDLTITKKANTLLEKYNIQPEQLLARHQYGDWSDYNRKKDLYLGENNDWALKHGHELVSRYDPVKSSKHFVWIITNKERTKTEILRGDEYFE